MSTALTVDGLPAGSSSAAGRRWRSLVAERAAGLQVGAGIEVAFRLPEGRWVDLDTILTTTLAGLRDAGALRPRLAGLDSVVATKRTGDLPGVRLQTASASMLERRRTPGPTLLDVTGDSVPRDRAGKEALRAAVARVWADRPLLTEEVWAEVRLCGTGSLLGPLEATLDCLEPCLGRDPRGRDWQRFFPNDHRITWLRLSRATTPALRLRVGRCRAGE